jgi:hypothetical protein
MVGSRTEKGRKDARRASEEAMAGELDVSIRSEDFIPAYRVSMLMADLSISSVMIPSKSIFSHMHPR